MSIRFPPIRVIALRSIVLLQKLTMKARAETHEELRQFILSLPGVTERQNCGIHEDAFFVDRTMFMHIHGLGHCDIRLPADRQQQVLSEGRARPHRWAPEKSYVTALVTDTETLRIAIELIRISHDYFSGAHRRRGAPGTVRPAK